MPATRSMGVVLLSGMRGARVADRLDLTGATLSCPLVCEFCYFDEQPCFVESSAKTTAIVASRLPGYNGTRMRLDGILNFQSSVFGSAVWLDQAKVTGQVCLREASADAGEGEVAVAADGLAIDGNADFAGLNTHRGHPAAERPSQRDDRPGRRADHGPAGSGHHPQQCRDRRLARMRRYLYRGPGQPAKHPHRGRTRAVRRETVSSVRCGAERRRPDRAGRRIRRRVHC